MATWQNKLGSGEQWIVPMDPNKQDFQATVVISKTSASGATAMTTVDIEFTLSGLPEVAAGTAIWVPFLLQDVADEFVEEADMALATNVGKPIVALRATAISGPVTVQVLQAG